VKTRRQTVEEIKDARTIERANAGKPRIPWVQAKKELQLD
jgi:hypothetical protein